jgi:putative Mg2+ transporter-C (MgtC) family protein
MRFSVVFVLSLIFGLERQKCHKPIGFGTYIFVAVGACALSITAITLSPENPISLMAAIVTGIGFLGAGALIKTSDKIFGFTSAASIWLFAILGAVVGVGEYYIALVIYISVWIVIEIDKELERRGIGSYQRKLHITATRPFDGEELKSIINIKFKIHNIDVNKKNKQYSLLLSVEGSKTEMNQLPKRLSKIEWIECFSIE